MFSIAVVIPTKNREYDLRQAIQSVVEQTYAPQEVIVVDQSVNSLQPIVQQLVAPYSHITLKYIYNPSLSGLTAAKNAAIEQSQADALLFIDDDIVLEKKFVETVVAAFEKYPDLDGVGGFGLLPQPRNNTLRKQLALIFQVGPFFDRRAQLQAGKFLDKEIVRTWLLSGGLSCLKRTVFDKVRFNNELPGACPVEDFDFYLRARKLFSFALVPAARAIHNISPVSRHSIRRIFETKTKGFYFIFKAYVPKTVFNYTAFMWRNIGIACDAVVCAFGYRSMDPIIGVVGAWISSLL